MEPFSRLRFRAYAWDLERAITGLSREMGATTDLKRDLGNLPGIDRLEVSFGDGLQHITLDGRTVSVGVNASIDQIRQALQIPVTDETQHTPMPPIAIAAAPKAAPAPGSFAAQLRAMMDEARAGVAQARSDGLAKVAGAVGKLNEAKVQTAQVASTMAKTIEDEANSVLAELGQISNMPPE